MPTIMRIDGMRVVIHSNDHRPSHVHVIAANGAEVEFWLHCPEGPPEVRSNSGVPRPRVRHAQEVLTAAIEEACRQWERIHGDY